MIKMISEQWTVLTFQLILGSLWFSCGAVSSSGVDLESRLVQGTNTNLNEALQFLKEYDVEASEMCFRVKMAQWNYSTNMTAYNRRKMNDEQTIKAKFDKLSWGRAITFDWAGVNDPVARRQLRLLTTNTRACLPDAKYNEIYHLISEMKDQYARVRVCSHVHGTYTGEDQYCDLNLYDVQRIMSTSRKNTELTHVWKEWHDKVGPPLKNRFMRYVQLANQASRINGFLDAGEEMRFKYDDPNFENDLAESFRKLQPLYKHLLTYVRRKLYQKYGPQVVRSEGPLPAHILGDLWAQDWSKISDIVLPYPEVSNFDVTGEMLGQGFTPLRIFQMAEEYFTSLGLKPMPPEFWRFSMLERPKNRKVQCTASAWDFCNSIDYRIKQCTEVDMDNLITAHREMAHIEYYLYYSDLPFLYRDGANPGFHEAVASAIELAVVNPYHLRRVGLFTNKTDIYESNINFLMLMALKKVAYAPFAYTVEQWRYQIFENGVSNMNGDWWDLRLRYQGVVPPSPRTEGHFDAASKRHIVADLPYIGYYVALLLEFEIYRAMCKATGRDVTNMLHTCDIYRSRGAGTVLHDILDAGKTSHWKDVIGEVTKGKSDKISADAMLEYFEPLMKWLVAQNRDERVIGWTVYKEDKALFQSLISSSTGNGSHCVRVLLSFVIYFYFII